jgi:hypothetical protein
VNSLFTVTPDGSDLRRVPVEKGEFVGAPRMVAFEEIRDDAFAVLTMRSDGSRIEELTPWSMNAGNPKWSPDTSHRSRVRTPTCT